MRCIDGQRGRREAPVVPSGREPCDAIRIRSCGRAASRNTDRRHGTGSEGRGAGGPRRYSLRKLAYQLELRRPSQQASRAAYSTGSSLRSCASRDYNASRAYFSTPSPSNLLQAINWHAARNADDEPVLRPSYSRVRVKVGEPPGSGPVGLPRYKPRCIPSSIARAFMIRSDLLAPAYRTTPRRVMFSYTRLAGCPGGARAPGAGRWSAHGGKVAATERASP